MNNEILKNSFRFVALIALQILVCNHILLGGYVNPYPYLIFIVLFPIVKDRWLFIISSFFLGLTIDFFNNSGGANAAACLVVAYLRPFLLTTSFGLSYEHKHLKFTTAGFKETLTYVVLMCLIHHVILFSLEVFNLNHLYYILLQIVLSTLFSAVLIILILNLFLKKK